MTINNANTDFYNYPAKPTNIYEKSVSYEKIATKDLSRADEFATKKPLNLAQKALEEGKPDSKATQISDGVVLQNRTFQFKDSVVSKEETAMVKQIMQQLVSEALVSHAAIIRSSHETKGTRADSAK